MTTADARHPYLPGDVLAVRINASVLGLVPLALHREGAVLGGNTSLSFPVNRHHGVVGDGSATVYAMMPSALKLFAEGRLPGVGGDPVEVVIGGRQLGPMVLTEVRCGGENYRHDIAVLVFRRAGPEGST